MLPPQVPIAKQYDFAFRKCRFQFSSPARRPVRGTASRIQWIENADDDSEPHGLTLVGKNNICDVDSKAIDGARERIGISRTLGVRAVRENYEADSPVRIAQYRAPGKSCLPEYMPNSVRPNEIRFIYMPAEAGSRPVDDIREAAINQRLKK